MSELTARQERFVSEYLVSLNATEAAQKAGYNPKTARSQASRLLTFVNIQEAIAAGQKERAQRLELTQDWVVGQLREAALDRSEGTSHAARVRALELLGKHLGMWPARLAVESSADVKLTLEQALQADRELEQWLPHHRRQ